MKFSLFEMLKIDFVLVNEDDQQKKKTSTQALYISPKPKVRSDTE